MASEFTIDIQLTELGFHQLPDFNEELPMKEPAQNSSSGNLANPPASPKLSPAPSKSSSKSPPVFPESSPAPSEFLPAPPKLSPAPSKLSSVPLKSIPQSPSKSSPAFAQFLPQPNKPPPVINSHVDQRLFCLVQQNVHSLPKTLPVAIMVRNTPSPQSTHVVGNTQPQPPQALAAIEFPEKAASSESNSKEDPLEYVIFTEETLALGEKKDDDGKTVSAEKKGIVVRYTAKQNSAKKRATAKEVVPQKDRDTSQSDGNVSQENSTQDESDDSEVSVDEEEEEDTNDEDDDSQLFAPDLAGEQQCSVCDQTFTNGFLLREHMHLHTGVRPYRCAECGKQFCQLANYRAHLRTHAQTVAIRCRVCQASFETEEGLQLHLETTHFEDEFYQCDYCKRIFTCMKDCLAHVQKHKSEAGQPQCAKCGRRFTRVKSLRRHMIKHACQRTFLCSDCGQSFRKKNVLLRHSFSHLGLLPYTCMHCNIHFRLANQYRKHKCKPESIQCVACLTTFTSHKDFEEHKRATGCWGYQGAQRSTLQKQRSEIRCMECGQTFATAEELKKHGSSHQRVLKCAECGMGFHSSLMLMSHMGGHVGQKPCLCQKCGLGFPHQQGYDFHLKDCGVTPPPKVKKSKPDPNKTVKKYSSIAPKNKAPTSSQKKANEMNAANGAQTSPDELSMPGQPADCAWKLTLDKSPPPNTPLVVLLPISAPVPPSLTISTADPQTLVLTQHNSAAASVQPQQTHESGTDMVPNRALQGTVLNETEAPLALPCEQQPLRTLPQPDLNTAVIKTEPESLDYSEACISSNLQNVSDLTSTLQVKEEPRGQQTDECKFSEEKMATTLEMETNVTLKSADLKTDIQVEVSRLSPVLNGPNNSENLTQSNLLISDVRSENLESSNLLITDVRSESNVSADCFDSTGEQTQPVETETSSQVPGHIDTPLDLRFNVNHSDGCSEILSQENEVTSVTEDVTHDELDTNKKVTEVCYFTTVEVDLREDHRDELDEDEEGEGEPHECVTCGTIILEGDLIEHYMEHAMQGDQDLTKSPPRSQSPTWSLSGSSCYSPSVSGYSSPNTTPPASPPSKRLRSRAK